MTVPQRNTPAPLPATHAEQEHGGDRRMQDAPQGEGALIAHYVDERDLHVLAGSEADPRALVLVRSEGRSSHIIDCAPAAALPTILRELPPVMVKPRGWTEGAGATLRATVVICTTGTSPYLRRSVEAVLAQRHDAFDLCVVDNDPASGATRAALVDIEDPRLSIVNASQPGLSRARNRGVLAATGEIIAFTDDDAFVDADWLRALCDPFASDPERRIGATTGIVLPAELTHRTQRWFEARGGFPKDLIPRLWSLREEPHLASFGEVGEGGPLYPVTTARVGAGVCMAFRAEVLREVGPFDPALGAGTLTRGGEDLDMFARVLRAGYAIIHSPDAVVHHVHRTDREGLERQVRGNGSGMSALITKAVRERPSSLLLVASRLGAVARRVAPGSERVVGSDPDVPASLTREEIRGFLEGPLLYVRARLRAERVRRRRRPRPSFRSRGEGRG
ncbi:glycosyltransferase family 2 protein [Schaalia sp. Marseille-Q2122]|uniref:glycosyltransferase family 2 protein n=1 Tax=Schaalia sp. Marseille-Q2122 TaxID=2736604 RepID=UPI0020CA54B1|nr:glycosyltransferase [Schaalia sp. Marseille-Q2122]